MKKRKLVKLVLLGMISGLVVTGCSSDSSKPDKKAGTPL